MAYEPTYKQQNKIICPLKLMNPRKEEKNDLYCEGLNCAWWMINQKACAVNVTARISGYMKGNFERGYTK